MLVQPALSSDHWCCGMVVLFAIVNVACVLSDQRD